MEKLYDKTPLEKLEYFFKFNMQIKNTISKLALTDVAYDDQSIMNYADKLYSSILDLETDFTLMSLEIFGEQTAEKIKTIFKAYKDAFVLCSYNVNSFRNYYLRCIADMRPRFVQEVKKSCVGYTMTNSFEHLLRPGITINELLHAFHSYIMNNEQIYQSVDLLGTKSFNNEEPISYRGKSNNELASLIYNNFPAELDCGITDIVSLDNKVMIMIRDVGHALTIEVEQNQNEIMIHYFIPKICNLEMVNSLKGINPVPEEQMEYGATGRFLCTKDNVLNELFSFISKVPTDANLLSR